MNAATQEINVSASTRIVKFPCRYVPQLLQGDSWQDASAEEAVSIFGECMLPYFASHDDGQLMYFHGVFDIAGEEIAKLDGKLVVRTGYPSGGSRFDEPPTPGWSARTLERGAAVLMLAPGDLVLAWTYHGWRVGYFVDRDDRGYYRYTPVAGGDDEVAAHVEAKRFERHERCLAQLPNGSWVNAVYYDFKDGVHLVHVDDTWELAAATNLDWSSSPRNRTASVVAE